MSALTVTGLRVSYGAVAVLHEVALDVRLGEIVSVIGGNGAGKTTLLKTIAGVLRPVSGRITADGLDITGRPSWWVARHGIALVPEGRGVFGDQSVRDNLRLGALARSSGRDAGTLRSDLDAALALFPALAEKLELPAASLSGGQQQMLVFTADGRTTSTAPPSPCRQSIGPTLLPRPSSSDRWARGRCRRGTRHPP
jgi:branched-chain amino acid transport system ATP-binding protein